MFTAKRGNAIRQALIDSYGEFAEGAPQEMNIAGAKEYLTTSIARLPRVQFDVVEAALPSGVSQSISALLPEPIYIPAVKNLSDDLKTVNGTLNLTRVYRLWHIESDPPEFTAKYGPRRTPITVEGGHSHGDCGHLKMAA